MRRASGKVAVSLYGGPYSGRSAKLSHSQETGKHYKRMVTASLMIAAKGMIGQYIDGRWQEFDDPAVLNDNIVLGEM